MRSAGHTFGADVSVGSVAHSCEQMFVDRRVSVGSVGQQCEADEQICVGKQKCRIGGEENTFGGMIAKFSHVSMHRLGGGFEIEDRLGGGFSC